MDTGGQGHFTMGDLGQPLQPATLPGHPMPCVCLPLRWLGHSELATVVYNSCFILACLKKSPEAECKAELVRDSPCPRTRQTGLSVPVTLHTLPGHSGPRGACPMCKSLR